MKSKLVFLLLIAVSLSCTEDDGTTSTITCVDNTYYALSTSDMANSNSVIDVIENTTSNITTSSFNVNGGIGLSITPRNNPSAWDKVNRQFIWFDQEENTDAIVYDELLNVTSNISLPSSNLGFLGRITAPVFLNGILYVMDYNVNPASPSYNIHSMNPTTGVLGPILASGGFTPGTTVSDLSFTWASATSNGIDTLYFRVQDHIIFYDVNTTLQTMYNNLGIQGSYISGLEYNADENLFYVVNDNNGSVELTEIEINGLNSYTLNTLYTGLNVNIESVQLEWKDCGKRLHLITHFNFGNAATPAQTDIIEFNLDASPSFVTQSFNSFIFGFVHKEI